MITIKDITKVYPLGKGSSVTAVDGANLEIHPGEFAIIVGRSGSGKTTLLNILAGLTRPTTGKVILEGTDLWTLTDEQQSNLRNQTLGFVFQFPSLLPFLTVFENMILPTSLSPKRAQSNGVRERASSYLEKVGLYEKRNVFPRQLSAGQQQRVVIARSLMNQPKILMADEPTSNLDEKTELEIMDLFADLHVSMGVTIIMVTHTKQLISYGSHAVTMAAGQIVSNERS
jgi:ABC-type lipoprotein export system ATPase subunit